MEVVKNANGKTVCHVDGASQTVEIVHKGFKTIIRFMPDGTCRVKNLQQAS